jgi:hypothetical protein
MTAADYRIGHQPMEDGAPIHDREALESMLPGVVEHPEWYGVEAHARDEHRAILRALAGGPLSPVTIYRAVPPGVRTINPGDWVAVSEAYARGHAMLNDDPADDWPVLSATVYAGHVRNGGGDLAEWGYWGPTLDDLDPLQS